MNPRSKVRRSIPFQFGAFGAAIGSKYAFLVLWATGSGLTPGLSNQQQILNAPACECQDYGEDEARIFKTVQRSSVYIQPDRHAKLVVRVTGALPARDEEVAKSAQAEKEASRAVGGVDSASG